MGSLSWPDWDSRSLGTGNGYRIRGANEVTGEGLVAVLARAFAEWWSLSFGPTGQAFNQPRPTAWVAVTLISV